MIKKIISFLFVVVLVFVYFLNTPSLLNATKLKILAEIDDNNVNIIDSSFVINSIIYWNQLTKIAKIYRDNKISYIEYENGYFYSGKDFYLLKQNQEFYIVDKKNEDKNYLLNGEIALTNKESNLFAIVQKNGLQITFYQYIPLQNRAIELKNEVFSSFYTGYEITKNSFYFSLMNGNCYIYNPFESLSSENQLENSPFVYDITANSSSNNYLIIAGHNPQSLIYLDKNGNILIKEDFENSYTSIYCRFLDNQLLLLKNRDQVNIFSLSLIKEKEFKLLNSLYIKGEILDILEFFSYAVFLVSDGNNFFIVFYNFDTNKFYKRAWKYPVYQLEIIDSNGVFSVYSDKKLWVL